MKLFLRRVMDLLNAREKPPSPTKPAGFLQTMTYMATPPSSFIGSTTMTIVNGRPIAFLILDERLARTIEVKQVFKKRLEWLDAVLSKHCHVSTKLKRP